MQIFHSIRKTQSHPHSMGGTLDPNYQHLIELNSIQSFRFSQISTRLSISMIMTKTIKKSFTWSLILFRVFNPLCCMAITTHYIYIFIDKTYANILMLRELYSMLWINSLLTSICGLLVYLSRDGFATRKQI